MQRAAALLVTSEMVAVGPATRVYPIVGRPAVTVFLGGTHMPQQWQPAAPYLPVQKNEPDEWFVYCFHFLKSKKSNKR